MRCAFSPRKSNWETVPEGDSSSTLPMLMRRILPARRRPPARLVAGGWRAGRKNTSLLARSAG